MVVLATVLLWLLLPGLVALGMVLLVRTWRLRAPMRNAWATGLAAATVVLTAFYIIGMIRLGPMSASPRAGWAWRVPVFTAIAATYASCAGWACATMYLGLRQYLRSAWGNPRCPSGMQMALAWLVLLALVVAYGEGWRFLADFMSRHP